MNHIVGYPGPAADRQQSIYVSHVVHGNAVEVADVFSRLQGNFIRVNVRMKINDFLHTESSPQKNEMWIRDRVSSR